MKMTFNETREFQKEFDRLSKKYASLPDDLKEFCKIVSTNPLGNSKHFKPIARTDICRVIKSRFFCRYLRGNSLRIVYAYIEQEQRIEYIEIYFKGDKVNQDYGRIKEYVKNLQNQKSDL